jgi:glycosyltransferase involved in cell wall biosynthesis
MSHGIPVIASRIGALAELIEDEVDGLLFEPGDAEDLARKVKRLWADADLCRRLGRSARAKAASLWGPRSHFERTKAIYQAVCAEPRGADATEGVSRRAGGAARATRVVGGTSPVPRDAGD